MLSKLTKLLIIYLVVNIFSCQNLFSQEKTEMMRGVVKDAATGEGLPFVTVQILGKNLGTNSNSNGLFVIKGISKGIHKIQITAMGYEKK